MKKILSIVCISIFLSACGGGTDNLEQQEMNQEEQSTKAETSDTDNSSGDSTNSGDGNTQDEDNSIDRDRQRMISNFVEDIYINNEISSISDIDNIDEITTEAYSNELDNVLTDFNDEVRESEQGDVDTTINSIELYDNMSNQNSELLYVIELEVVDHDTENINLTQIIGEVELQEEDNSIKINDISELSNQAINE